MELCLRLARFKKENKELLTYLLFEEDNLAVYISNVKKQMDEDFSQMNITNLYFAKKTLRKILRIANKYIRYTGSKEAEAEILMHYLTNLKGLKISWKKSTALTNLYQAQIKKIKAAVDSMHEDLQYDHKRSLDRLVDF
jgi:gas vesicle protein